MTKGTKTGTVSNAVDIVTGVKALDLRVAGKTYHQIGAALGIDTSTAHRIVKEALEEMSSQHEELTEQVRSMELSRLDAMIDGLWPRASTGDEKAVSAVLGIMERRARYVKLDHKDAEPKKDDASDGKHVSVFQEADRKD